MGKTNVNHEVSGAFQCMLYWNAGGGTASSAFHIKYAVMPRCGR